MSTIVSATDGQHFDLDVVAQSLSYNSDNTINYIEVVHNGKTYRQTYTWSSGQCTNISAWVKQ